MNKILNCPFCGKTESVRLQTSSEWEDENDLETCDLQKNMDEYYHVICDASKPDGPGGCGASTGFFDSEEKAIESWNTRA